MNSLLEDVRKEPSRYQTSERIEGLLNVISEVYKYYVVHLASNSILVPYSEKHWREKTLANSAVYIIWERKLW